MMGCWLLPIYLYGLRKVKIVVFIAYDDLSRLSFFVMLLDSLNSKLWFADLSKFMNM